MVHPFHFDDNADEARIYLCLPNKDVVAELYHSYGIQESKNYGGINTLNFKLPYRTKKDMKYERNLDVDILLGDYLIKYTYNNEVEYYVITKTTSEYRDGVETLAVECSFLPIKLSDKVVKLYEEMKPLYDFVGTNSILHDTLIPMTEGSWTVGQCDVTQATKFRKMSVSTVDLFSFLGQLAETYQLILKFDTVNQTVSFYAQADYGIDEGLVIDEQYLKSLNEVKNSKDIITRLYCYGNDNMSIGSVNSTGEIFIEDFSWYLNGFSQDTSGNVLTHSKYWSDSLCKAQLAYQDLITSNQPQFQTYVTNRNTLIQSLAPLNVDLDAYKQALNLINKSIDTNVKTNLSVTALNAQQAAKQAEINAKTAQINSVKASIANVDTQIAALKNLLALNNNFTTAQLKERNGFIKEKVWNDSKYVEPIDLYTDGIAQLKSISQPNIAYEMDSIDFIRAINTPYDRNKLKLGSVVTINFDDFNVSNLKAKVINIEHSHDDNSLKLKIANSKDINNGFKELANILSSSVTTSATVDFSKGNWDKAENTSNIVTNYINNSLDAAKQSILSGNNNAVQIDERGISVFDNSDHNKVLRITNGVIAISNDNQQTFKTAITSTGVSADVLAGRIMLSNNLYVSNTAGTVNIDGNGMTVNKMDLLITRTDNKSRVKINAADGIKIQGSANGGSTWTDKFYADTNGDITITGSINATGGSFNGNIAANGSISGGAINSANINYGTITGSNINIGNGNFTVNGSTGAVYANNGYFSGTINASSGSFSGTIYANGGSFSGNITASGKITGGIIDGATIKGATIDGGYINVTTDLKVGNNIYIGSTFDYSNKYVYLNGLAYIFSVGDSLKLTCPANIDLRPGGQVLINGSPITAKFS